MADNDIAPSPEQPSRSRLVRAWYALWAFGRAWSWQILAAVLVIAFILAVVRPFSSMPAAEAEDVAKAWNQSIARLGILPVFPPEEDLYVGDLWAVVADAEDTPLLGKAVRIAHINLREEFRQADSRQPVFVETAELKAGDKFRRQERKEIEQATPDDRIALTLAAFPGITITHTTRAAGSLTAKFVSLGAGRDDQQLEQIRIRTAETYGVRSAAAFARLDEWCSNARTKIYCTDEFVRRVVAFSVSDRVLATRKGRYIARLQLRLVTRVFLTREIEHRRSQSGARGGVMQGSAEPRSSVNPPSEPPKSGENSNAETRSGAALDRVTVSTNTASGEGIAGGRISTFRADGADMELHEVFQRPVAFGYRAVTIDLTPATPSTETTP
jgi:hypothetical protein